MTEKPSAQLISDLARLIDRHGLRRFEVLLQNLRRQDVLDDIAEAIVALRAREAPARPGAKPRSGPRKGRGSGERRMPKSPLEALQTREPDLASYLEDLQARLVARSVMPSRASLQGFADLIGYSDPLPKERRSAVRRLILKASELPLPEIARLQQQVVLSAELPTASRLDDWARTIMGHATEDARGPSDTPSTRGN